MLNAANLIDLAPIGKMTDTCQTIKISRPIEKIRASYLSNVKQAKSQVIEISAAIVCGLVVVLALIGLS